MGLRKSGIRIPRVTYDADRLSERHGGAPHQHLPGDLVFFRDPRGDVHHVGISLGGDKFIHAPHTGDVVKVASLNEPYYAEQFTGGRRFAQAVAGAPAQAPAAPEVAAASPARRRGTGRPADRPSIRGRWRRQAAAARDAAEARRHNSGLFMKIQEQENRKENERRNR